MEMEMVWRWFWKDRNWKGSEWEIADQTRDTHIHMHPTVSCPVPARRPSCVSARTHGNTHALTHTLNRTLTHANTCENDASGTTPCTYHIKDNNSRCLAEKDSSARTFSFFLADYFFFFRGKSAIFFALYLALQHAHQCKVQWTVLEKSIRSYICLLQMEKIFLPRFCCHQGVEEVFVCTPRCDRHTCMRA